MGYHAPPVNSVSPELCIHSSTQYARCEWIGIMKLLRLATGCTPILNGGSGMV